MRADYPQHMDRVDQMVSAWRVELPELPTLHLELVKRVGRLSALISDSVQESLTRFGVTYAEFDVLATLRRSGPPYRLKPGELARQAVLTTGGISNILQRLTAAGLVEREPDPDDRRSSWVRLTGKGSDLVGELSEATMTAHGALFHDLPDEDARALADQLREVLVILGDR